MRVYSPDEEIRVRLAGRVREWAKAGLLSQEQAQRFASDLTTDLRRTGLGLRLGLALFTAIAGAAATGLVFLLTDLRSEVVVSLVAAAIGVGAFHAATMVVRDYRLYRHGVEEALAVGAVGLFGLAAGLLSTELFGSNSGSEAWFFAMLGVAAGAVAVYRRFGFQYAAVVAPCAVALAPMAFRAIGPEGGRLFAALVFGVVVTRSSLARRHAEHEIALDDWTVIRAAAAGGLYLSLNLHLLSEPFGTSAAGWFRWGTWGVTWILPFVLGRVAVTERDPLLLRIALAAMLASLVTNKAYLGWARQPWDPMVLGIVLVGAAVLLRRWLATGADGERGGFTARPLLERDAAFIQMVSLASVAVHPVPQRHSEAPADPSFSGGRSGGAGAGTEF
ncbi:MAG: hypothetical protein AB7H96_05435 [Vicinamibacterales bacterium]